MKSYFGTHAEAHDKMLKLGRKLGRAAVKAADEAQAARAYQETCQLIGERACEAMIHAFSDNRATESLRFWWVLDRGDSQQSVFADAIEVTVLANRETTRHLKTSYRIASGEEAQAAREKLKANLGPELTRVLTYPEARPKGARASKYRDLSFKYSDSKRQAANGDLKPCALPWQVEAFSQAFEANTFEASNDLISASASVPSANNLVPKNQLLTHIMQQYRRIRTPVAVAFHSCIALVLIKLHRGD